MHILDIPMMVLIPSSGYFACRIHKAEKSPSVQPIRQRNVLIVARFHVCLDVQNPSDVTEAAESVECLSSFKLLLCLHPFVASVGKICRCNLRLDV